MKKGLLLTLVIAVALLSSSVFAYAPVLENLPDVVIGDVEEGASNNFFIFSDAFIFDDYVSDLDTTVSTHIKWSFSQMVPGSQTILINGLDEETDDATFIDPTNELRAVSSTASFRNDTASPTSGSMPFPTVPLENVSLAIYVSDGIKKDSDEIMVYTIDDFEDGLSGIGVDPIYTDTFDTQGEWVPWVGFSGTAPASIAVYDAVNKRLANKFPSTWTSPFYQWLEWNPGHTGINMRAPYAANHVYVLKTILSSDANDTVPALRLRAQSSENTWTSAVLSGLLEAGETAPSGTAQVGGVEFQMVWQPQGAAADAFVAVDMFAANSYTGEVYVEDMNLYSIELGTEATLSPALTISNFTGWVPVGNATIAAGSLTVADPGSAIWGAAGNFVLLPTAIQANEYYRLSYNVSISATTARAEQVRLRVADTKNGGYGSNFVYNDSSPSATLHLGTAPQAISLWHYTMNGRSSAFAGDLSVFFDYIDSASPVGTTNPSAICTGITIEKAILPALN